MITRRNLFKALFGTLLAVLLPKAKPEPGWPDTLLGRPIVWADSSPTLDREIILRDWEQYILPVYVSPELAAEVDFAKRLQAEFARALREEIEADWAEQEQLILYGDGSGAARGIIGL